VVQLASAGPGSGKSTLAVLLARSLAQSGKRVLLVDADMHRPSLAQHFAIALSPGLLDLLARGQGGAGGAREGEAGAREGEAGASPYHATSIPTLSVLPSGRSTRQADQELLVNGTFSTLLAQWRGRFDFILLDGPPLLQSADAAILSRHADGTILVVRQRHCRRMALVEALAVLSSAGGKLLGTVFVGSGHEQVYGYGYGYAPGQSYRPGSAADQPLLE
jgi:Mrp family chromosome partitioning ATPase